MKTSISLPVKVRIAQGLSHAGTSNTLKVVSYNAVLGVIAVFSSGAIRQFCAFSIVVLVAHWFLVHTFFVTVVSIDIQRLEVRASSLLLPDIANDDISWTSFCDRTLTLLRLSSRMPGSPPASPRNRSSVRHGLQYRTSCEGGQPRTSACSW